MIRRLYNQLKQYYRRMNPACVSGPATRFYATAVVENNGEDDAIQIGTNTHIRGELMIFGHGGEIVIGDHCFIGEQSRIWSAKQISIGDRVLISHLVSIFDSQTHPLNPQARHQQFLDIIATGHPNELDLDEKPVRIENDVWIGAHSVILAGVTIGEGAVVGAGSVVTKDVEPYSVVAGNPATLIKKLPVASN